MYLNSIYVLCVYVEGGCVATRRISLSCKETTAAPPIKAHLLLTELLLLVHLIKPEKTPTPTQCLPISTHKYIYIPFAKLLLE